MDMCWKFAASLFFGRCSFWRRFRGLRQIKKAPGGIETQQGQTLSVPLACSRKSLRDVQLQRRPRL